MHNQRKTVPVSTRLGAPRLSWRTCACPKFVPPRKDPRDRRRPQWLDQQAKTRLVTPKRKKSAKVSVAVVVVVAVAVAAAAAARKRDDLPLRCWWAKVADAAGGALFRELV